MSAAQKSGVVAGTRPYAWPWDTRLSGHRLALLLAGNDAGWQACAPLDPDSTRRLGATAQAVRDAGGVVIHLAHRVPGAPAMRDAAMPSDLPADLDGPDDVHLDAAGLDGFHGSALDTHLRAHGRDQLVLAGWGLEGPVHSTLRAANDQGYECLLLTDAAGSIDPATRDAAHAIVTMSGGIFGAIGTSDELCAALAALPTAASPAAAPPLPPVTRAPITPSPITPSRITRSPITRSPRGRAPMTETTTDRAAGDAPTPTPIATPTATSSPTGVVQAEPYDWPYDGRLDVSRTALVNIDWQTDFCGPGGYVDHMGYDLGLTRAGLAPTAGVLAAARLAGMFVIHTREGHKPDLSDCPPNKLWRSRQIGAGIGDRGPCGRILVRGEPGWDIVPEVYPIEGEPIVDKPGKGAFYATDLDLLLRTRGITHIILTGITTDVCVHTTMREANDRGYECLLLSDCTGATDHDNYLASLEMVKMQGGVFGAVAPSEALLTALRAL